LSASAELLVVLTYENFYDVVRCYTTYYFVVVSVIMISSHDDDDDDDDDALAVAADSTGIAYPLYIIMLCM